MNDASFPVAAAARLDSWQGTPATFKLNIDSSISKVPDKQSFQLPNDLTPKLKLKHSKR
jgi:hypothetical protein